MEKAPAASAPPAEDDKLIEIQHAEPVEATWSLRRLRTRRTLPCRLSRRLPSRASSSAWCSGRWARGRRRRRQRRRRHARAHVLAGP